MNRNTCADDNHRSLSDVDSSSCLFSFFLSFFSVGRGRVRGGSSLFVHIIFGYRNDHFDCSSPM